jgi:hypothetical protein
MNDDGDIHVLEERRRFLGGLASVFLACLSSIPLAESPSNIRESLRHFFKGNNPGPADIGRRYLANVPSEASEQWLVDAVFGSDLAGDTMDVPLLIGRVRMLRQRDFARGDVIEADGWLIARTEARLCALATLCFGV